MPETRLGNDVVDLLEDPGAARLRQPRWLERVLQPGERTQLAEHSQPELALWQLWAAKEAAYKLASRLQPGPRFVPRRFRVDLLEPAVFWQERRLSCAFEHSDDWLHAMCWLGPAAIERGVERLPPDERGEPEAESRRARQAALRAAAAHFGAQAEIGCNTWKQPQLLVGGLRVDLSLSHHGRFVAWAFPRAR